MMYPLPVLVSDEDYMDKLLGNQGIYLLVDRGSDQDHTAFFLIISLGCSSDGQSSDETLTRLISSCYCVRTPY